MEQSTVKSPLLIYTEQTPNPETLKFVTNKMLFQGTAEFQDEKIAKKWSPLAIYLFDQPYVNGVYICNNFVTVTKEFNYAWDEIMMVLKQMIKDYVDSDRVIVNEGYKEAIIQEQMATLEAEHADEDPEIVSKIKELIDTYVKPAVEMDGGNIEFKSFNKGVVNVLLQGSCSGCPSSTVTLKSGIENMLKRMVPQVISVEAYAE